MSKFSKEQHAEIDRMVKRVKKQELAESLVMLTAQYEKAEDVHKEALAKIGSRCAVKCDDLKKVHSEEIKRLQEISVKEMSSLKDVHDRKIDAVQAVVDKKQLQEEHTKIELSKWYRVAQVLISAMGEDTRICVEDGDRKVEVRGNGFDLPRKIRKAGKKADDAISTSMKDHPMASIFNGIIDEMKKEDCNCTDCKESRDEK
jgi:hypothetical protein